MSAEITSVLQLFIFTHLRVGSYMIAREAMFTSLAVCSRMINIIHHRYRYFALLVTPNIPIIAGARLNGVSVGHAMFKKLSLCLEPSPATSWVT